MPANAFFIPVVITLAVLHLIVAGLMFSIFSQSSKMSQATQESGVYIAEATSLLAGSSLLSETSSNYVLMPVTAKGEPNVGPLSAYVGELGRLDHRGDTIAADFETYRVSEGALAEIELAAKSANALIDMQLHAIALVSAVYPLPDNPALANLELPALSAEEAALSDDQKMELARTIMLDTEYGRNKGAVSENVNKAIEDIRASSGELTRATGQTIGLLRTLLSLMGAIIVLFLALAFVALYRQLISPLSKISRLIENGAPLSTKKGMREIRLLAESYNDLLHRRDSLEEILREAAETDTLTGLPNRYSLQQQLLDAEGKGYALAVFLFDVDYLKQTNDTLGHAAGDGLIKRASQCISTCFGEEGGGKCYRIGGDEFAAVIRNYDESDLPIMGHRFEKLQQANDVSISWGYAYSSEIGDTSFRILIDEADRRMYHMKVETHRKRK